MSRADPDPFVQTGQPETSQQPERADGLGPRPHVRARVIGWTFTQALRAMHASWRKDVGEIAVLDDLLSRQQPHILSFWHRKFVALCPLLRGRHACVVTSNSPRGHVIASVCRHFGNVAIQISDHGRATESLNMIGHAVAHSGEAGIAVDGPAGPYHKVKRGAIQVASELGHLIVPISVGARRKHVFVHRWDHLEIPAMFTRVHISVGEPMRIPPDLSRDDERNWRARLHDALEEVDAQAEKKVRRLQ